MRLWTWISTGRVSMKSRNGFTPRQSSFPYKDSQQKPEQLFERRQSRKSRDNIPKESCVLPIRLRKNEQSNLHREGSEVVLEVGDDGAGLDRAAIRRRAEERGLIRPGATLSDSDLDGLIFEARHTVHGGHCEDFLVHCDIHAYSDMYTVCVTRCAESEYCQMHE